MNEQLKEQWRDCQAAMRADMFAGIKCAAVEILEYRPDATELNDVIDDVNEQADSLVPVYYGEQVSEWLSIGMPEGEEYHGADSFTGVHGLIAAYLFEWYNGELSRVVGEMLAGRVADND